LTTNNDDLFEQATVLETINENIKSRAISPVDAALKTKHSSGNLSNFEARLLSSFSTSSPNVNPQEFGFYGFYEGIISYFNDDIEGNG
jgi:hypothetical protein